ARHSLSLLFFMTPPPPRSTLFPYTTLFRSDTEPALATPGVLAVLTGADLVADGLKAMSHRPVPTNPHEVPLKSPDGAPFFVSERSEEHTSELQSRGHVVCRLLLEKKK